MARICVDITKPDAGLLAPAQPLHPYAQPPQAVELKDELRMLVLSGDVDALDAKLAGIFHDAGLILKKAGHAVAGAGHTVYGAGVAAAKAAKRVAVEHKVQNAADRVKRDKAGEDDIGDAEKALAEGQEELRNINEEDARAAQQRADAVKSSMAQALRELCLLGRADAGTAPRQLVGIEAEIEAYKQHAAHAQQMQAMAAAVYPGQAPAVYPGQVLASPAVYPGQGLASPAVFQPNPHWMRYTGC